MNGNSNNTTQGNSTARPSVLGKLVSQYADTPQQPPAAGVQTSSVSVQASPVAVQSPAVESPPTVSTQCFTMYDMAVAGLDVLLSDGHRVGLQYHLFRPLLLTPDGRTIELKCEAYTLRIKGYTLEPLFKGLLAGRVNQLWPLGDVRFAPQTGESVVTGITLHSDEEE